MERNMHYRTKSLKELLNKGEDVEAAYRQLIEG